MICGIQNITFSTDAWQEAEQFFNDWGLRPVSATADLLLFETLDGTTIQVRHPNDTSLAPAIEPGPTLRQVVWSVRNAYVLEKLIHAMQSQSSFRRTDTGFSVLDPHGLQLCFEVEHKKPVTVQGSPSNPYGLAPQRINKPSPEYDRATPITVGHVVLFSDCLAQATAFYQTLGFVISDSYPNRGVFMRGLPDAGHHDLFLLQLPNKPKGLNHIAFTVRDIHEVFGGGMHMSRCGWKTQLGPGRHPISSAYFWYFNNPCGGLMEYNADEDHLTADWQAREFEPSPTRFAEWAIDGGIDGNTRRQPNVQASSTFLTDKK